MRRISRVFCLSLFLMVASVVACGGSSSGTSVVSDVLVDTPDVDFDTELPQETTEVDVESGTCATDEDCAGLEIGICEVAFCGDFATCEIIPIADHSFCDDGDKCTAIDTCLAGQCTGSGPVNCDDGNPCTDDSCDPEVGGRGCVHLPAAGACDDGNACTSDDSCVDGACQGQDAGCACAEDADCRTHEDGNFCNGTLACVAGRCVVDAATEIICESSSFDAPCQATVCLPHSGVCVTEALADGVSCEDGNPCTMDDVCAGGSCIAGDQDCDACDADEDCELFDDPDLCNGVIGCIQGECSIDPATIVTCSADDDTQCARNVCVPGTGECHSLEKADTVACSDGNLCSVGDACLHGQCIAAAQLDCMDENLCTDDTCDPTSGCVYSFNDAPCDDADACTDEDHCVEGACAGAVAVGCDDENPCTKDVCLADSGCLNTPNTDPCEDGNPCTIADHCSGGVCLPGANECPCVADADCDAVDDGDKCNGLLVCVNAHCLPKPNSVVVCDGSGDTQCKTNTCDPETGICGFAFVAEGGACNDGDLCTNEDQCIGGTCISGRPTLCGDGDPCTVDTCSSAMGCQHAELADCVGCTSDADCLDADPCTVDRCDGDAACTHGFEDGSPCDDGDKCTGGDACLAGECQPGELSLCAADQCEAESEITCEQMVTGDLSLVGLSDALDHYSCNAFDFAGPEQVFHFAPAQSGLVTFTLFGESDLYVVLLQDLGDGCSTGACLDTHTLELSWDVEAGQDYYVVVDGYAGALEPYELRVDCAWAEPEICDDEEDNDLDGLFDCDDPDCGFALGCYEVNCADMLDDDLDGLTDCADDDCFSATVCNGGWSGDLCGEDSLLFNDGEPFGAEWLGESITRWFTTADATDDYIGTCLLEDGAGVSGPDVAYFFELAAPMSLTLDLSFDGDTAGTLWVYSAPVCAADFEVACETPIGGLTSLEAEYEAGGYYVIVDGLAPGSFALTLTFETPVTEEAICFDGLDDDNDGLTDCEDTADCGDAAICTGTAFCIAADGITCEETVSASLLSNDATDAIESYACPDGTQAGYQGPERTWSYTATCTGTATAHLTYTSEDALAVDLFLMDGATVCEGASCQAMGLSASNEATIAFAVEAGAAYWLVADGYLGAAPDVSLDVSCACDEVCDNEIDDDEDGLTDCADSADCYGGPGCPSDDETDCFDGHDNDADGDTDCGDVDCLSQGICPEMNCGDNEDNDFDSATDCADAADCAETVVCSQVDACVPMQSLQCNQIVAAPMKANDATDAISAWTGCDTFGSDYRGNEVAFSFTPTCTGEVEVRVSGVGDETGSLDVFILDATQGACAGSSCVQALYSGAGDQTRGMVSVATGSPMVIVVDGWDGFETDVEVEVDCLCLHEDCVDGIDNDGDGMTDCDDDACRLSQECPEPDCDDGIDDDGDSLTDCDDLQCKATPACPETDCANGVDDNNDGRGDCADTNCFAGAACTGGFSGDSCTESFLLRADGTIGQADYGTTMTRWYTTIGAGDSYRNGCSAESAVYPDLAYHFVLADPTKVTFVADFFGRSKASLMLYSGGLCVQENELACAVETTAAGGKATMSENLDPGEWFVVVESDATEAPAGEFQLTLTFEEPTAVEGACGDGIDSDLDGLTDCADVDDCADTTICLYTDSCHPHVEIDCGATAAGDLAANNVTDAISSYICPGYSGTDYAGPEASWQHTAQCTGTLTATVSYLGDSADDYFELFLLDGAVACDGSACLAVGYYGLAVARQATLEFAAQKGDTYVLVADGYDGAVGELRLDVACVCDELCDNELDDDEDGKTDCEDEDCYENPVCPAQYESECFDEIDEDEDGLTDCADMDCLIEGVCPESSCINGLDDNIDGKTDCGDPDCAAEPLCAADESCVPAATLACDEVAAGSLLAPDSTDVIDVYACDTVNDPADLAYRGPERSYRFVAPCTGAIDLLVTNPTGDNWFDAFVLDEEQGCNGAACIAAVYSGAGGDVSGSFDATEGKAYVVVVDGWGFAVNDFEILIGCGCQ